MPILSKYTEVSHMHVEEHVYTFPSLEIGKLYICTIFFIGLNMFSTLIMPLSCTMILKY